MKTINWKKAGLLVGALISGVAAFADVIDKKNQEDTIKELVEEVAKLKGKES